MEYEYVLSFSISFKLLTTLWLGQADQKLAASKVCQPLRKWNPKWLLGLDMLLKTFRYESKKADSPV